MKKILICALCFMMLIAPLNKTVFAEQTNVSADDQTAEIKESIKDEVTLLTKAGVLALSEKYNPNSIVTRAEFADYTALAIKADEEDINISYFADVPTSYWASGSINTLVNHKIIDKADDGKFNPDEPITYAQACKMMAAMTGYKAYADMDKIMNEYISVAQKAGFGINTASLDSITLAEAIKLIYNAMRTDLMSVVSANGDSYTVKSEDGETIFSVYHKIGFSDGRVTSVYGKTMNSQRAESGQICIGGEKYDVTSDVDVNDIFGRYVNFAYKDESETKNVKTVIYARGRYDNDVTTVLYDDIKNFDESTRTLTYYADGDSGKERTKSAVVNAVTVLNGQPYDKGIKSEIDKLIDGSRKGEVTYISGSGSSACDLICVISYELFDADSYNSADKKFYSPDKKEAIKLDDYETYVIKDVFGSDVETDSIQSGPYMIAAADNKESITIIICSQKVEGILSGINRSDRVLTVGDEDYTADKLFFSNNSEKFNVGASYKFWLDQYGEIIDYAMGDTDGMKIGYITKTTLTDSGFEKELMLRIYTPADSALNDFKLADRVKIDEQTYKAENYKDIASAFPGNAKVSSETVALDRQIIRYSVNSDGKINKIDTRNIGSGESGDTTLRRISNGVENLVYTSTMKRIGMNMIIDSKTSILVVPSTNDDGEIVVNGNTLEETARMYSNTFTFSDWQTYALEVFKYSEDTLAPDLVVVYTEPKEANYNVIMYDDIITALGSEGEIVNKLTGTSMGAVVQYELDDMVDIAGLNLKKGDIVRVESDFKKEKVFTVTKMFDAEKKQFEDNQTWKDPERYWYGGNYTQNSPGVWRGQKYQLTKGFVYDIKGTMAGVSYKLSMAYNDEISEMTDLSKYSITVFDPNLEKNRIYSGSASDILTFKTAGADCDMIITASVQATIKQIFIFKNKD